MTNPTSNFGWQMPTPTDLVTDLPADFEVFGQAVDTSMADLKGGTTGQILSKASATDMDFTWITNDVGDITAVNVTAPITGGGSSGAVTIGVSAASTSASGVVQLSDSTSTTSSVLASTPTATKSAYDLATTANTAAGTAQTTANAAIPKSTVTTSGDVIYATGSSAVTRLGIGSTGQVLTVSGGAPAWATPSSGSNQFFAGKNKLINADFYINQRGFTSTTTSSNYGFDRWIYGAVGGTATYSAQTFTAGAAPVSGYEGKNYARLVTASQSAATDFCYIYQRIEDVRNFAGQTVTVSFWAKAATGTPSVGVVLEQQFGTGGSGNAVTSGGLATISTSWARYSKTIAVPSISGKTIGTGLVALAVGLMTSVGTSISAAGYPAVGIQNATIDFWGIQIEAGSTATDFQTASGSIGGELALCQRYCYVVQGNATNASSLGTGYWNGTTAVVGFLSSKSQMRTTPTLIYSQASDLEALQVGTSWNAVSAVTLTAEANAYESGFQVTTTGGTNGQAANLRLKALSTAYIGLVAEL
jgi:hypothetical protein